MNALFISLGISKQAFYQKMVRMSVGLSEQKQLLLIIHQIREDHPTIGCRDIFYILKPVQIGHDAFELFCKEEGLTVTKLKNWQKTTDGSGIARFDTILTNLIIN